MGGDIFQAVPEALCNVPEFPTFGLRFTTSLDGGLLFDWRSWPQISAPDRRAATTVAAHASASERGLMVVRIMWLSKTPVNLHRRAGEQIRPNVPAIAESTTTFPKCQNSTITVTSPR